MTRQSDASISAKIQTIRIAHGNPGTECPTCGNALNAPYRRWAGVVIEGCIDACHTGRLPEGTETANWHYRMEARAMRADTYRRLKLSLR